MSCELIAVFGTLSGVLVGAFAAQAHNIIPRLAEVMP